MWIPSNQPDADQRALIQHAYELAQRKHAQRQQQPAQTPTPPKPQPPKRHAMLTRTQTAPRIHAGRSQNETFSDIAEAVLFDRLAGSAVAAAAEHFPGSRLASGHQTQPRRPHGYEALEHAPLAYIARHFLEAAGTRLPPAASAEEIALAALQQGGGGIRSFHSDLGATAGPTLNRPGDFPGLLDGLAGKILDMALELAAPTYPHYTRRLRDAPDFKPINVLQTGNFSELGLILDGQPAEELAMGEELGGWLQVDRYGNRVGLTPIMLANNDIDAWGGQIASLAYAHEQTLNRLCLSLLTGNVTLLDGVALYDAAHGNVVTGGGAPSAGQAGKHRELHLLQTAVDGVSKVRTPPAIALVPVELQDEAEQAFLDAGLLLEAALKRPSTDATINVHRGKITPYVEPELSDVSAAVWYSFADPRLRAAIAHVFQAGYGPGGRRTSWFDQATEVRWTKLEGRFAVAAISHRGTVRNPGS